MVTAVAVRPAGSNEESAGSLHDFLVAHPRPHFDLGAHSPAVFETNILPHLDAAFNLARWLVHDAVAAEYLVEEVCIRALRGPEAVRGGDERVWLLRMVRNAVYAGLEIALCGVLDQDGADDAGVDLACSDPQPDAAVTTPPIELRECLILRELGDCSYREIAFITGVPIDMVASRLGRARQLLSVSGEKDRGR